MVVDRRLCEVRTVRVATALDAVRAGNELFFHEIVALCALVADKVTGHRVIW